MNKLHTPKKPVAKDWHRADVKAALEKAGITLRQLSIQNGYAPTSLVNALNTPWPAAERIIAAEIGVAPHVIWPSRYDEHGNPKSGRHQRGIGRRSGRKSTSQLPASNVENVAAA
ncbi:MULTISPECIES: helix-turn-helix domain-containing protein [Ralstonia solanacearum species complex]|uniref:transcriptional repressor n=1 Tax=Ralstonia phage RS138 TaxID=1483485 RepID=UPI0006BCE5A3|nr:helix-turn-helix transcriptional regulator [Ralstonia solanacearum]YP_009226508.1 transcriptional repressor [Ralstonia phage RS138]BEU74011.1 hypothetical protein MAFF211271_35660 [Ralstonia pseudosolanacearum]AXV78918.1 transcriptional regulator [Ralstonia solanacearum]AXV92940.1 transcriptional regulator [Ralstonia solanacearum]AXW21003.1 transcriptional regulator [Ralstonia solanacearum]AXW77838.1 transcriptional regulator [Ralstonia solanacearum]